MKKSFINTLLILTAVIAVGMGFMLLIMPTLSSARENNTKLYATLRDNVQMKEKLQAVQSLNTQIAGNPQKMERLHLALPKTPDLPEVFVAVESLASKIGVTLDKVTPEKGGKTQGVKVSLAIKADYGKTKEFLTALNANVRPVLLDSLSVKSSQSEDKMDELTTTLSVIFATTASGTPVADGSGSATTSTDNTNAGSPSSTEGGI